MADGQILIDTRISTDEVKQDTANLKKKLESLASSATASAKKIDRAFDSIDIDDAAEGLGESFEKEVQKIEPIPEEIEKDFSQIDLEDAAEDLEKSFEKAWDDVKRETTRGADHVKDKIENVGDEAEETGDKIKRGLGDKLNDAFTGLSDKLGGSFAGGLIGGITSGLTEGALNLLEDAGRALVEFGKKSINLASDLQEVQNVVDVTFYRMSSKVDEFAKNAITSAGLSEAAAKRYVGTYGTMAKSFGFTEQKAYEMSTALTQLAGDVASFYNLSGDEAYSKLTAVFTGETEALKELGVVMTDTALNAYAMEKGFRKTTQKMTEQEKVALRYMFVLDKLSSASGDFAATQDSWANQTKILSEQWNSFSASVGEGLISLFTPGIQFLTGKVMPVLQEMGDAFAEVTPQTAAANVLAGAMQGLSGDLGMVAPSAQDLVAAFQALGWAQEETASTAEQLSEQEMLVAAAAESTSASVSQLRLEYDQAKEAAHKALLSQVGYFDELSVKSSKSATDIVANWEKQREAFTKYAANLEKAVQLGLDETLVAQLSDGSQESMAILNELVNSTDLNIDEINKAFEEVQQSRETVESTMADIQTDMSSRLEALAGETETEWGEMAGVVGKSIAEMQNYIDGLKGKDVYVNVITRNIGGTSTPKGSVESADYPRTASAASVPYLASGAVIPPNAPFAAVLGDQRNGTNLEAPEGLIRDIFREEMSDMIGGMMAGFEAMVAEQQATRTAIEDIQIGDTTIGRAAARYDRRQNLIRGGATG